MMEITPNPTPLAIPVEAEVASPTPLSLDAPALHSSTTSIGAEPSTEMLAALRDAAVKKAPADDATYQEYLRRVQLFGEQSITRQVTAEQLEKELAQLRADFPAKLVEGAEAAAASVQRAQAIARAQTSGEIGNLLPLSTLEAITGQPTKDEQGKLIRNMNAVELAYQQGMSQRLSELTAQYEANPVSTIAISIMNSIGGFVWASVNQNTSELIGEALGKPYPIVGSVFSNNAPLKDLMAHISQMKNPAEVASFMQKWKQAAEGQGTLAEIQIIQDALAGARAENHQIDAALSAIPVVSVGTMVAGVKAVAGTASSKVAQAVATASPKVAAQAVVSSLDGGTLGTAIIKQDEAVRAATTMSSGEGKLLDGLAPEVRELVRVQFENYITASSKAGAVTLTETQRLAEVAHLVQTMPLINKSIVRTEAVAVDVDGVVFNTLYETGALTEEAAKQWAKERGITSFEVVPKNVVVDPVTAITREVVGEAPKVASGVRGTVDMFSGEVSTRATGIEPLRAALNSQAQYEARKNTLYDAYVAAHNKGDTALAENITLQAQEELWPLYNQWMRSGTVDMFDAKGAVTTDATKWATQVVEAVAAAPAKKSTPQTPIKGIHGEGTLFQTTTKVSDETGTVTLIKNLEAGSNVTAETLAPINAVMKKMGITRNIMVVHPKDLAAVQAWGGSAAMDRFARKYKGGTNEYTTWAGVHLGVSATHSIILLRDDVAGVARAFTGAHELGHAFVLEYLNTTMRSTSKWGALEKEFTAWRDAKKTTAGEFISHQGNPYKRVHKVTYGMRTSTTPARDMLAHKDNVWWGDFEEFFAEQFSKHLLGQADIQSSFFTPLLEAVKEIYEVFLQVIGKTPKPVVSVQKFLEEHAKQVANKQRPDYSFRSLFDDVEIDPYLMMQGSKEGTPTMPTSYMVREFGTKQGYLYTHAGTHDANSIRNASGIGWIDPKQQVTEHTYNGRLVSMYATAVDKKATTEFFKASTKGLSGKEQRQVWGVLGELDAMSNAGDALKNMKVDVAFLRSKGLDDRQIVMFDRVRTLRDMSWAKHNTLMANDLRREGYMLRMTAEDAKLGRIDAPIKMHTTAEELAPYVNKKVFDQDTGKMVLLGQKEVDELVASGRQVGKLKHPVNGVENILLSGDAKLGPLNNVLPYRPHEFSRIYTEPYFITHKFSEMVDGVLRESTRTIRTAKNAKEAVAFSTALNKALSHIAARNSGALSAKETSTLIEKELGVFGKSAEDIIAAVDKGEIPIDSVFSHKFDRTKEDAVTSLVDEHIHNGRMFESQRGSKLLSVYADRVNTASPVESMGIEMSVMANKVNMSEWRAGAIAKYLNSFVATTSRTGNDIHDFMNAPIKWAVGTKEHTLALSEQRYVASMVNGRSMEEKVSAAKARLLIESLEGKEGTVGVIAEKVFTGMGLRNADPLQFLRTINFHVSLGMFNPAQFIMQSMSMLNAIAVHPVHGFKAAMTALPLRFALMSDNPEVWRKLSKVGRASTTEQEFVDLVQSVRKSGIIANIHNTALYNSKEGFDNIFKEYGSGAFGKLSTTFFDRGEEFSRLVSWDVARRDWMTKNVGGSWKSDEALAAITARMDDYNMGMTQVNLANYQRGLLSIPAQFLQYNLKLGGELIRAGSGHSRIFSQADAAKLVATNLIMFGTAGNGLREMADQMFGKDVPEEARLALTQGALASVTSLLSGGELKLATGSRYGTLAWYPDTIKNIASGEMTLPEMAFGITRSNIVKSADVLADVMAVWHPVEGMTFAETMEGLQTLTGLFSGMSNANKAYILTHNGGRLYDKRGALLTTVSQQEAYAQLFGIQPADVADYYYNVGLLRTDSKDNAERVKNFQHLNSLYYRALSEDDMDSAARYRRASTLLMTEDPQKAAALLKSVRGMGGVPMTDVVARKLEAKGLTTVTGE